MSGTFTPFVCRHANDGVHEKLGEGVCIGVLPTDKGLVSMVLWSDQRQPSPSFHNPNELYWLELLGDFGGDEDDDDEDTDDDDFEFDDGDEDEPETKTVAAATTPGTTETETEKTASVDDGQPVIEESGDGHFQDQVIDDNDSISDPDGGETATA